MSPVPTSDDVLGPLSERERAVLYAVVTEFIQTGEPVGSRTLSTGYGFELSAATIRNALKDLDDAGYLSQPHPSAGRVPTQAAFRVFIDALMQMRELSQVQQGQIRDLFSQNLPGGELVRESGRLLSELSGQPAVILRSRGEASTVHRVRFIPNRPGELLSVVIHDDGTVENRFIQSDLPFDASQFERLHNLLDEVTEGRTLAELSAHLLEMAERERNDVAALGKLGDQLLRPAVDGALQNREVIVEGQSTLLSTETNPGRLREMMLVLEDREQLAGLLDRTIASEEVQVYLGKDEAVGAGDSPLSVVAAPYSVGSSAAGVMGSVGTNRMDYPALIPLVRTMAASLSRSLGAETDEKDS